MSAGMYIRVLKVWLAFFWKCSVRVRIAAKQIQSQSKFVANIVDCSMRQTNNFLVPTVHRVINRSGKERYSACFFFGFDRKQLLELVPTCVSADNPMKYPVMTSGEYCKWRTDEQKSSGAKTEERLLKKKQKYKI